MFTFFHQEILIIQSSLYCNPSQLIQEDKKIVFQQNKILLLENNFLGLKSKEEYI